MTDEVAMAAVSRGELAQTAVLYERYKRRMFNFFRYLRYDREQSMDLTQQVFYRLLLYRHTYRGEMQFTPWIYRLARNIHHDHQRPQVPMRPLEETDQGAADEWAPPMDEDEDALVRRALALLPQESQEVLILSRFEGMPYEQIARQLGCSTAVVKMRVYRAIQRLRTIYQTLQKQ